MNLGSPAENRTARILEGFGYLVASRRHVGGAGDLVALPLDLAPDQPITLGPPRGLLIEVKRGRGDIFENFRHGDRVAMIEAGFLYGLTPLLAYWPWHPGNGKMPIFIPVEDWP